MSHKYNAENQDDQLVSTLEQYPTTNEPEKSVPSTTTTPEPQDRGAFVDDLIDLRDNMDRSASPDAAMGASFGHVKASFSTTSSSSRSITDNITDNKVSLVDALQGNIEKNPDAELVASCKPGDGHDTRPIESTSNHSEADRKPTRKYYKPQKHNSLTDSKYATTHQTISQPTGAHDKPAASSTSHPAGKDFPAVVKKVLKAQSYSKHAKKGMSKVTTGGRSGVAR